MYGLYAEAIKCGCCEEMTVASRWPLVEVRLEAFVWMNIFFLRKCKNKFDCLIYEMNWNLRLWTLWLDSCRAICIDNCSFLRLLYLYTVLYFTWTWKWPRRVQNGVRFYRWCLLQNLYQRNLILKIIFRWTRKQFSREYHVVCNGKQAEQAKKVLYKKR